jgi:ABC-2 type transport system ATP-binding protein
MEDTVTLSNIYKSFKGFKLNNVSFSVKKGFITGFIGPNGSGKTTIIKLIMDLMTQDSGTLNMFGMDSSEHIREAKQRIGFVFDENHFYDHLTVRQMKQVISPFYKRWDETIFRQYMDHFELPWKKKIKHLSTGMKMKLSLAISLSHHADFIIMDEPTSGLDPFFRREVLDILSEVIQYENKTIFFPHT